jgi:cellulose synthase/poly-beta-1,6-N-acetylglucosamine synthase-like glycosyltransferase
MGAFLAIFAVVGAEILGAHLILAVGVFLNFIRDLALRRRAALEGPAPSPKAEVIVAVRNEVDAIGPLLESLSRQTMPGCSFLFVDDRSTDGTGAVLDAFCGSMGSRARVIHNGIEPRGLTGKQLALELGLAGCRGDILLFTDADCRVPEQWVEGMCSYFRDPAVGAVIGRIELSAGDTFLSRFQAFEQPLINQYNFGSAGIGMPTGCFGNNMAVRARAVREAGGFARGGYAMTEDAELLSALRSRTKWKVRVSTQERTAAVTRPKTSWAEFVNQHARWNAGAFFSRDAGTRIAYGVLVGYLMFCALALPFGVFEWKISVLSLNAFLSIGVLGLLGGAYAGKRKREYFLKWAPYTLFFGFFYSYVSIRALFGATLEWKGTELPVKRPRD